MNDDLFLMDIDSEAKDFRGEFKLLPPGWHNLTVTTAELKLAKSGSGRVLHVKFDAGITIYINIFNDNPVAERIGRAKLAKILQCAGMTGSFKLKDMPKLFGRKIACDVVQTEGDSGKMFNEIIDFKAVEKSPSREEFRPVPQADQESAPW